MLIPTPAVPVLSSTSVAPPQVLYEAENTVPLQIGLICSALGCYLGVLNLILFMILFVLFVSLRLPFLLCFAVCSSAPPRCRVICALPEPSMPAAAICENAFSALKEELLYDFPLNLGFDDSAPHPMRRFCISAIGIESPTAANMSLIHTCQSPELEPALDSDVPLTHTCPSSEPVLESKPNNITSRAPEHKGVAFTKSTPKPDDTSP